MTARLLPSASGAWQRALFALRRLGWVAWLGLLLLVSAIATGVIAPIAVAQADAQRRADIAALQARLANLADPHAVLRERNPQTAFARDLPDASSVPDFVTEVEKRADAAGLQVERTEYHVQSMLGHAVARYRLHFPAHVDYRHLRPWIEGLLHDYPSLAVDDLSLHRAAEGAEELDVSLGMSYLAKETP